LSDVAVPLDRQTAAVLVFFIPNAYDNSLEKLSIQNFSLGP